MEVTDGVITTSLWDAIASEGGDPYLTLKLSDIYAWTVDFFGIQQGDSFKIYYENQYVDGEPIGISKVLAAYLNNAGSEHYAYYFEQNGKGEYFDEKGANLRKAFLKAPLNYRRISSTYSHARKHPVTKVVRPHHGVIDVVRNREKYAQMHANPLKVKEFEAPQKERPGKPVIA